MSYELPTDSAGRAALVNMAYAACTAPAHIRDYTEPVYREWA